MPRFVPPLTPVLDTTIRMSTKGVYEISGLDREVNERLLSMKPKSSLSRDFTLVDSQLTVSSVFNFIS